MSAWILWLGAAWARAGGGHSYGGSSSGGGSFSGGGGSFSGGGYSGGGGTVYVTGNESPEFLVFLVLLVVVVAVIKNQQRAKQTVVRQAPPPPVNLDTIRRTDPDFSRTLFLDFARLVYTRAQEERHRLDVLGGLVSAEARASVGPPGAKDADQIVIGAARINAVAEGPETTIRVFFETNLTIGGETLLSEEMWRFVRPAGRRSPGPTQLRDLRCVNCGSALETKTDGTCVQCGTQLDAGQFPWVVRDVLIVHRRPVPPLALTPGGGIEVGTDLPTLTALDLRPSMEALARRHPDFDWVAFRRRVVETFTKIQKSWAEMKYEDARPYETDFLYQSHRYWIERYRREAMRNRMADLMVTDVKPVKVEIDAHVEAFTVRIYARMKDWTERRDGTIVSGSKTEDRIFSEYWTFVRSVNAKGGKSTSQCPSCGAALDKVGETGVCGYCESRITTGDYDWVLAAIEQDEAYRG